MGRSYPQQGVEGTDGRYLRRDGSVPLTATWFTSQFIQSTLFRATSGGNITLGHMANNLRFHHQTDEIIELTGVSNNQANLHLKNLRVGDLAGVGNRNVIADVNGDLSAP